MLDPDTGDATAVDLAHPQQRRRRRRGAVALLPGRHLDLDGLPRPREVPEAREQVQNQTLRAGADAPVAVSALTGEGTDDLLGVIERRITSGRVTLSVTLAAEDGEGLGWLYRHGEVLERSTGEDGVLQVALRIPPERAGLVTRRFGARRVHTM